MIKPIVTVGIPNYNGAKYIRYAIESVLNQSYLDFELIITDDGSTDNSVEIIQDYQQHPNVRLILSNENHGLSYRLNEQISLARGKYFCRMDADDIMFPDRIEKQVEFLEGHPDIDVVGSSAIVIDEYNKILGMRNYIRRGEHHRGCSRFIHPTVMARTSFFLDNCYSERFSGVEDTELWRRTDKFSTFMTLNEPLLFYRDPLEIRVKTYVSRLFLIENLLREERKLSKITICSYLQSIVRIKCQELTIRCLDLIGKTHIWAKRRNIECCKDSKDYYQEILDEQTKITHSC